MRVITITDDEITEIISAAIVRGVQMVCDAEVADKSKLQAPISANVAAKLVRRRRSTVLDACRTGELASKQTKTGRGGRPEYRIKPADAIAWANSTGTL